MNIPWSAWQQIQYNLVEDFLDLFLPPSYPLATETNWPQRQVKETFLLSVLATDALYKSH